MKHGVTFCLPADWERKKLGEICEIVNGGTPKTNIPEYWDGNVYWITPADLGKLSEKTVNNTSRKISELGLKKSSAKLLPKNSIILSTRAPIGYLVINKIPMSTNQGCRGIVPSKSIDVLFLYFFLKKNVELLDSLGTGATFKELSKRALSNIPIPLPPLPEQRRIVELLDRCFAVIDKAKANAEKNLKNVRELFESELQAVFEEKGEGWEIKKLGEVCKVIAGQSPEGKYYNSEGNGIPFYQGKKDYGEKYIKTPTTWTSKTTKEAEAGDVLMSVRAPVGPVNFATQKICIGRGLAAIRAGYSIDKDFLFNFLLKHENEIEGNTGAVFNSINKTQIENIPIPVPPLPEQQTIVCQLDALRSQTQKLEKVYQKKIAALEELKKSILQKAFTGKLTNKEAKI